MSLNLDYFLFILYPYVRIKYLHMYHSVFIFCIDYLLWYRRNFFAHNFSSMELAKDIRHPFPILGQFIITSQFCLLHCHFCEKVIFLRSTISKWSSISSTFVYFVYFYEIFKLYLPPVQSIIHLFILLCIIYMGTVVLQLRRESGFPLILIDFISI